MEGYSTLFDKKIIANLSFLNEGDTIFAKSDRSYRIRLPSKINEDIAYLAGVIAGDGSVYRHPNKYTNFPRTKIMIFNASRIFLEKLNIIFKTNFGYIGCIKKKVDKNCYILTIHSKIIWLYFTKIISLPLNKKYLKVPRTLKNKKLFKYFLAGFFDTDGYFSGTFGCMLGGRNFQFLSQITKLSKRFYVLNFSKPKINVLRVNNKRYLRAYTQLKSSDITRFRETIPLIHERYFNGPAGNRTQSLCLVKAAS